MNVLFEENNYRTRDMYNHSLQKDVHGMKMQLERVV